MSRILTNETDPYSFMGLVMAKEKVSISHMKQNRGETSPIWRLMNAGLISLILAVAILKMAQGNIKTAQIDHLLLTSDEAQSNMQQKTICRLEACNMV